MSGTAAITSEFELNIFQDVAAAEELNAAPLQIDGQVQGCWIYAAALAAGSTVNILKKDATTGFGPGVGTSITATGAPLAIGGGNYLNGAPGLTWIPIGPTIFDNTFMPGDQLAIVTVNAATFVKVYLDISPSVPAPLTVTVIP